MGEPTLRAAAVLRPAAESLPRPASQPRLRQGPLRRRSAVTAHDCGVEFAGGESGMDRLREPDTDSDAGIRRECPPNLPQQAFDARSQCMITCSDAELHRRLFRDSHGLVVSLQQRAGPLQKGLPFGSELDQPRRAVQELAPKLLFQGLQPLADDWLNRSGRLCGAREAAVLDGQNEELNSLEVEHNESV